jgi:hypothetical protein
LPSAVELAVEDVVTSVKREDNVEVEEDVMVDDEAEELGRGSSVIVK